jgi:phage gp36-like protein
MFLVKSDFFQVISENELNLLISYNSAGDTYLTQAEKRAVEDVKGYLRARYDVATIFRAWNVFDETNPYLVGDRIINNDVFYLCIKDAETGTQITDTEYFTESDDRNTKLIEVVVDICIYNLLSRLNNIDISDTRKQRYDGNNGIQTGGAIGWLKKVQRGEVQPDIPLRSDAETVQTGNKIMYGYAIEPFQNNESF